MAGRKPVLFQRRDQQPGKIVTRSHCGMPPSGVIVSWCSLKVA